MFGVLIQGNQFDVKRFGEILSEIQVCDNYSLKELCVDSFKNYIRLQNIEMFEERDYNFDPFEEETDENYISYKLIYGSILTVLCEKLYGRIIDIDNLTKDDIDSCVIEDNPNTHFPFIIYTSVITKWDLYDYTLEKYVLPAYISLNWNNIYSVDNRLKMLLFDSYIDYIIDRFSVNLFSLGLYSTDDMLRDIVKEESYDLVKIVK